MLGEVVLQNTVNVLKKQNKDLTAICGKVKSCEDQDRSRFKHSLNYCSGQKVS